jgi:hypothetical protein
MRKFIDIRNLGGSFLKVASYSLYLNEMLGASLRLAPAGPRTSASKIAPGDFVRKNLAANLPCLPDFP